MARCKHVFIEGHTKTTLVIRCTLDTSNHTSGGGVGPGVNPRDHLNFTPGHKIRWSDTNVHDGMMA